MGLDLVKQDEETQKIKTQVKTCINIYTHINIGGGNEAKKYILEQQHLIALTKVEIEAVSSSKAKKKEPILWLLMWLRGFPGGVIVKNRLPTQETQDKEVWSLSQEDPLE